MLKFDSIFKQVAGQPFTGQKDDLTMTANCHLGLKTVNLTVHARVLQQGSEGAPIIICLPWYGGKSAQCKSYFGARRHPGWTYIGIDIFNTRQEFHDIRGSALVSQYAYALVMRMIAEQVRVAHAAGRKIGIVGISYGANVLSAYTTLGLELPDAIVAIEGGSILQITLQTKYKGHDTDPAMIKALEKEPDLIPVQVPVAGAAAAVSAAVINRGDTTVIFQEELWKSAADTLYVKGTHFTAPLLNRCKILQFADAHLERLLLKYTQW